MKKEKTRVMGRNEGGQLAETNRHRPRVNQEGDVRGGLRDIFDLQKSGYEPKEIKLNTQDLISLRVSNPP